MQEIILSFAFITVVILLGIAQYVEGRPVKALHLGTGKDVHLHDRVIHTPDGKYKSFRDFETYVLDKDTEELGLAGDLLLCKYEKPQEGCWCVWWDLTIGPYVYKLKDRDCRNRFDRLPIIKFVVNSKDF